MTFTDCNIYTEHGEPRLNLVDLEDGAGRVHPRIKYGDIAPLASTLTRRPAGEVACTSMVPPRRSPTATFTRTRRSGSLTLDGVEASTSVVAL